MASTTISMTPQELQTLIFNSVQEALTKAAPVSRRRTTKNPAPSKTDADAVPPSSASVAGSTASKRSLGAKTQEHIDQGIQVTAIVKRLLSAMTPPRKMTGGMHLKVGGYLKPTLANGTPLTDDLVRDAISFLDANPDYKSKNQQNKATKTTAPAATGTTPSSDAPVPSDAAPKKRGRPAKNATEGATKPTATKPKKVAPPPPPPADSDSDSGSDSDGEDVDMLQINIGGTDYFWNEDSGDLYEITEGTIGDRVGSSTDGKTIIYA